MTHGVASTLGHCAGNGGLRGHSVGGVFPCVIYQKGLPDALTHWVLQPNGVHAGPHATFEDAWDSAVSYNAGDDDVVYSFEIRKVQLDDGEETASYPMAEEVTFSHYGLYAEGKDGLYLHLCDYSTYPEVRDAKAQCVARINDAGGVGYGVPYRELLEMLS